MTTRTGRPFSILFAAIAALLVLSGALALLFSPVQAQSAGVLVSNIEKADEQVSHLMNANRLLAQSWRR